MYRNLEAEIVRKNLSKKAIAETLGITYNTLLLKIKGESSFTLDEALALRSLLNTTEPVEVLFSKTA